MVSCTFVVSLSFFCLSVSFLFKATAPTEIYTLSLHDALPIWLPAIGPYSSTARPSRAHQDRYASGCAREGRRSEEHTSELQSLTNLVCRLLLEKKKKKNKNILSHDNSNYRCHV